MVLATPYILEDEPEIPLKKNKSFKELINKIKFDKVGAELYKGIETLLATGKFDYTTIVMAAWATISSFVPALGIATPIISLIFPPLERPSLFEQLKPQIEALINERLNQEYQNFLNNQLQNMKKSLETYQQNVINASASDATDADKQTLRSYIEKVLTDIDSALTWYSDFSNIPEDQITIRTTIGLPYYTLLATLYLTTLKDVINNSEKWGFSSASKRGFRIRFKSHMNTFVNKIKKSYQVAFDYVIEQAQEKQKKNPTYKVSIDIAQFQTQITLTCLDVVATWPTLYPDDYSNGNSIDLQKTRLIFSPILGRMPDHRSQWLHSNPYSWDNNTFTSDHYYMAELTHIDTNEYDRVDMINQTYVEGYQQKQKNYLDSSGGGAPAQNASFTTDNPLAMMYPTRGGNYVNTAIQWFDGTVKGGKWGYTGAYSGDPDPIAPDDHKVNFLYTVKDELNGIDAWVNSWVSVYTTVPNIIGNTFSDTTGEFIPTIQGFPFEKGIIDTDGAGGDKVYQQERLNGAMAINLKYQQILQLPFTNLTSTDYIIRLRYASHSDINAFVHIQPQNGTDIRTTPLGDITLPNTSAFQIPPQNEENLNQTKYTNYIEGNAGKYALYQFTQNITLPSGQYTFSIQNNSNSDFFLDRIEFIPIPPTNINISNKPIISSNVDYEIWKSDFRYGRYLTGIFLSSSPYGTQTDTISVKYWDNKTLIHTEFQEINMATMQLKSVTKWEGHFNRITVSRTHSDGTLTLTGAVVYYDIPQISFTTPEDLENITNQVNALFTSSSQTELAQTVTDYGIDQVVLKVNALSDDVFGVEKKALRKLVNQAKQLSKARNVLVGGNFEKGHEWVLGREATTVADHDLFKGDHLLLPPPTMYPSYAYQKIDESKLKSNTRYTVSGFVAQSEHLEVVVSRYGKEVHDMLDVPYEEALPITSDERPNCCKPSGCQCPSCNGDAPDSHFFSYSIDVGSLQSDVNLGIEFGLRIAKSNGFAKISNLEIKEDRPLTEKEIKKIQRKEQKWKKTFDQEQAELAATLQPTLNQINALYQNEDWNSSIHPHVTYQHLSDIVLPTLPKQTHWFMEDREGEHVVLTQQFQQALDRAFQQIEEQNLIHNGNFANGLTDWTVTGDAQITIYDEDPVLELAHWDASVSQTIEIIDFEEEKEYKLRVRGKGKGTVTVQHGEEELETMTFNATSFTTQEQTFYFEGNTVDIHVQSENNAFLVDSLELIEVVEE